MVEEMQGFHDNQARAFAEQAATITALRDRIDVLTGDFNDCNSERARWKDRATAAEAAIARLRDENGWQPIETAPNERTVLLWMVLLGGEPLGHDIGWLEDGDWMVASKDNEPARASCPTRWMPLPAAPLNRDTHHETR